MSYTTLTPAVHKRCYKIPLIIFSTHFNCSYYALQLAFKVRFFSHVSSVVDFVKQWLNHARSQDYTSCWEGSWPVSEKYTIIRHGHMSETAQPQKELQAISRNVYQAAKKQEPQQSSWILLPFNLTKVFEFSCHLISRMNQPGRGVRVTWKTCKQTLKLTKCPRWWTRAPVYISFGPEATSQMVTVNLGKLELATLYELLVGCWQLIGILKE